MKRVILASQSPRRKELMLGMGLKFDVVPSNFEEQLDDRRTPEVVAIELAVGKASQVAMLYPDSIVIGSDTIVTIDGNQLEKPRDEVEAYEMLERLSGTHNEVTSSLAVIGRSDNILLTSADTTRVYFKPFDEAAIRRYVESGDTADKAGAYGIQSGAAPLIDHIEGNYDTVVGLPTRQLVELLRQVGITSHPVTLTPPVKQVLI